MRLSNADLRAKIAASEGAVPKMSFWKHVRTRKTYVAHFVALRSGDTEQVVVYSAVNEEDIVWVRPVIEFTDGRFEQVA